MVKEMIVYGLFYLITNVFWVLIHVFSKYGIISLGYRKKAQLKKIERRHKQSKWWRKLYLSELTNNSTEHPLLVGVYWLYNAAAVTCGPLVSLICYVLVCITNFANEYVLFMLKIPLICFCFEVALFFIPSLLFVPEFRNMYFRK